MKIRITRRVTWAATVASATVGLMDAVHVIRWQSTVAAAAALHESVTGFLLIGSIGWFAFMGLLVFASARWLDKGYERLVDGASRKITSRRVPRTA